MTMRIGSLPDGSRGFDANSRITSGQAHDAIRKNYRFAVRYVRRAPVNPFDVTAGELATLLDAGLGVMLVQHVASTGRVSTGRASLVRSGRDCREHASADDHRLLQRVA
jgi:hypothetical protein